MLGMKRAEINRKEDLVRSRRQAVQFPGNEFLAGAVFAEDQDVGFCRRGTLDERQDVTHCRRFENDGVVPLGSRGRENTIRTP